MGILPELVLQVVNGFVWGWILALLSLGLTLVFGLLEVVNIAHGALYAFGAIGTWYFARKLGNFWLSLLITPLVVGALGMGAYVVTVRPVESTPIATVIATFGLLLIFQHLALLIFGPNPSSVPLPVEASIPLMGRMYPVYRLLVAGAAMVIIGGRQSANTAQLTEVCRKVNPKVRVMVVPGSQNIKRQAEAEGLDTIFREAGADFREAGCSMCIAMNGDQLQPGQYSVSTSNRNFEGRQGKGGRTFLASPLTAAASAITGVVTDVRTLL